MSVGRLLQHLLPRPNPLEVGSTKLKLSTPQQKSIRERSPHPCHQRMYQFHIGAPISAFLGSQSGSSSLHVTCYCLSTGKSLTLGRGFQSRVLIQSLLGLVKLVIGTYVVRQMSREQKECDMTRCWKRRKRRKGVDEKASQGTRPSFSLCCRNP
jgi:hypothetical protein